MDDEEIIITPIRSVFQDLASAIREVYDEPEMVMQPNEFPSYIMDIPEEGAGGQTDATTIIKGTVRKVLNSTATAIKSYTFAFCSNLTTATFPEVKTINTSVFESCPKLRGLTFPKCDYISSYAFRYCTGISKISFPECITVGEQAFAGCSSLYSLYLPKCEYISASAFKNCSIKELDLPSIKSIANAAFVGWSNEISIISLPTCETLAGAFDFYNAPLVTEINLPNAKNIRVWANGGSSTSYSWSEGGWTHYKDAKNTNIASLSFPECEVLGGLGALVSLSSIYLPKCSTLTAYCLANCWNLENIYAPSLLSIGYGAFLNCSKLSQVPNGSNVTSIGYQAFDRAGITSFENSHISRIDRYAFYNCSQLSYISIPKCSYLEYYAFCSCIKLDNVWLPLLESVTDGLFAGCHSLRNISLPLISLISGNGFSHCSNLSEVFFPNLYSLGAYAFSGCINLSKVTFINKFASISISVFQETPLTNSSYLGYFGSIYVPESYLSWFISKAASFGVAPERFVTLDPSFTNDYIGVSEFASSNITEVPAEKLNAKYILNSAFYNCSQLSQVSLSQVKAITSNAFQSCSNLLSVNFPACETLAYCAFSDCSKLNTASFPECTTIGRMAFSSCFSLTTAYFPKIESVSDAMFAGYSNNNSWFRLVEVNFHNLKSTPTYMFSACRSLTSVDLTNCEIIGLYTFSYCTKLSEISLPAVKSILDYAFYYCYSLSSLSLPQCTYIGYAAFASCHNLSSIYIPNAEHIGRAAFVNCFSLTYVDAPNCYDLADSSESAAGALFGSCYALTSFNIPGFSSLTVIGPNMFYACNKLSLPSLNLSKMTSIGNSAFAYCDVIASSITSLDLPELEYIGSSAFAGSCYEISYISLPKLKTLGGNIVYTNMSPDLSHRILMSRLYLPQCQNISYSAFWDFPSLKTLVLPQASSFTYNVGKSLSALESVYLLNTTIPSITYRTYIHSLPFYDCSNVSIYVRASLADAYRELFTNTTNPSDWFQSRIVGITDEQVANIIAEAETW